jgi:hypothetical protein
MTPLPIKKTGRTHIFAHPVFEFHHCSLTLLWWSFSEKCLSDTSDYIDLDFQRQTRKSVNFLPDMFLRPYTILGKRQPRLLPVCRILVAKQLEELIGTHPFRQLRLRVHNPPLEKLLRAVAARRQYDVFLRSFLPFVADAHFAEIESTSSKQCLD